mgnify:CR=1 FL=1
MLYPYMTIGEDEIEVTYGKAYMHKGVRCIDVCVERATENDLINVIVSMPFVRVKQSYGMSNMEINSWVSFIKKNYTLISEMSLREEKKVFTEK